MDLTTLGEPQMVPRTVAFAAGVRDQPEGLIIQSLIDRFRVREHLLVIDSCEHLIAACAELAANLSPVCPRLRIVATSREPVHIDGENGFTRITPSNNRKPLHCLRSAPEQYGRTTTTLHNIRNSLRNSATDLIEFRWRSNLPRRESAVFFE